MKKITVAFAAALFLASCFKEKTAPAPTAASPILPAQNEVCAGGTPVNSSLTAVLFTWQEGQGADSYEVSVKNLVTGISVNQKVTGAQAFIPLTPGNPYSWYVRSHSSATEATAESPKWKFYLSSPGATSYAPFPADSLMPSLGQTVNASSGKVTLSWTGSDVNNDIVSYDVYFGTSDTPPLLIGAHTATSLPDVPISALSRYYWKVITRDSKANTSDSGVFQFVTN
jgi:hypothetical protein